MSNTWHVEFDIETETNEWGVDFNTLAVYVPNVADNVVVPNWAVITDTTPKPAWKAPNGSVAYRKVDGGISLIKKDGEWVDISTIEAEGGEVWVSIHTFGQGDKQLFKTWWIVTPGGELITEVPE